MSINKIKLPHEPQAVVTSHVFPSNKSSEQSRPRFVVFLNGMVIPQMGWHPVIKHLMDDPKDKSRAFAYLTYDRFGQGMTMVRNANDERAKLEVKFWHDLDLVVKDLEGLINATGAQYYDTKERPEVILLANSIGGAVARHYTASHPGQVAGIILLDSVLASSTFQDDIFPDPQSPSFDRSQLPNGFTVEDLIYARKLAYDNFSPNNPNREGFDRRNMRQILPSSSEPKLIGVDGKGPILSVIGHDPETFAKQSAEKLGMPLLATTAYVQPAWEEYNQGLLKISDRHVNPSVKIAKGCGHFVQMENPTFVADEINSVLQQAGWW